jgi:hypothetical protein
MWGNGTNIRRFIDGVGFEAVVVSRGEDPGTIAQISYLDDGKEEKAVPVAECEVKPNTPIEVSLTGAQRSFI